MSSMSFRARDVDFRFALDSGRIAALPRMVETGQKLTHAPQRKAQLFVGLPTSTNEGYPKKAHSRVLLGDDD
jgi:hypothetical protein